MNDVRVFIYLAEARAVESMIHGMAALPLWTACSSELSKIFLIRESEKESEKVIGVYHTISYLITIPIAERQIYTKKDRKWGSNSDISLQSETPTTVP